MRMDRSMIFQGVQLAIEVSFKSSPGVSGDLELRRTPDREWWEAIYRCPGHQPDIKRFMSADCVEQGRAVVCEVGAWVDTVARSGMDLATT